jgi:tyrosine decarboxylase/aspartate 1-decarboxylase
MDEKGLPREIVLKELETRLQGDLAYASGKILSSMCTEPHVFARQVYAKYFEKNLGDPGLFPATSELERETVRMLGSLLSNPKSCGYIVSGGTEANILALWAARNLAKGKRREVIVPISAHFSFDKAADMLGLKLIKIGLNEQFQVDVNAVKNAVTPRTLAIVGIAGTTGLGVVDPIPELSDIAEAHDIYLHVDAAFGGFVLPFLKELGLKVPDFDFKLPGVSSITVDPHKMGLAPIPAGGILFRDCLALKAVSRRIQYLAGGEAEQATIIGSRPGASVIAVWALLKHLGKEGYRAIVKRCMKLTWRLADEVNRIEGLRLVTKPIINIVGIKSIAKDIRLVVQKLRRKGWAISTFDDYMRIVIMPHVKTTHITNFLKDLRDVMKG